jgi:hypothetical protein
MAISDLLRYSIDTDSTKLANAKANNQLAENIYSEYQEFLNKERELKTKINDINIVIDICNRKRNEFRDIRLREIETRAENMLELIFPEENFGISIETERKRGVNYSTLKIGPKNLPKSLWERPAAQNGGFVEQIISTSVLAAITQMYGSDLLILDEQFCSGDPQNCSMLKPFFDTLKGNTTVLIIEHKPELYSNLDRREIRIAKDRIDKGEVVVLSIEDKEGA